MKAIEDTPYRTNDAPAKDRNPHARIGAGWGSCLPPGFWSRVWHGIKDGHRWRCDCGQWWFFSDYPMGKWKREGDR